MALRHAVLAALLEGEASGYQLAKRFDVSVANFWSATPQQLYRELEQLERAGLLSGRVVEQQRRPNKRVFTLTVAGREELHAFTTEPARPTAIRDDLLVKLQAVDVGDEEAVRAALATRLEQSRGKLSRYDRLRDDWLEGRDEDEYLREADRVGPYLTLMAGRLYEQENIRWSTAVLEILERRCREDPGWDPRQ
jgi:DNA-binding PadR family transcriptional regulator